MRYEKINAGSMIVGTREEQRTIREVVKEN